VHVSEYVAVADGVSVVEPLVASVPDHAPEAAQDVVFVELHASVVELPAVMVEGDAVRVAVGGCAAGGFTVTVAVPDFVGSCVEVAVMVALPELGTVAGAVYSPELEIVPVLADQVTVVA
jgi:hypothetical protein